MGMVAGVDVGSGLVSVGRDTSRHSSSERSLVGCLLNITSALHCFTVVLMYYQLLAVTLQLLNGQSIHS